MVILGHIYANGLIANTLEVISEFNWGHYLEFIINKFYLFICLKLKESRLDFDWLVVCRIWPLKSDSSRSDNRPKSVLIFKIIQFQRFRIWDKEIRSDHSKSIYFIWFSYKGTKLIFNSRHLINELLPAVNSSNSTGWQVVIDNDSLGSEPRFNKEIQFGIDTWYLTDVSNSRPWKRQVENTCTCLLFTLLMSVC